jgi:hypothetical protein
MQVGKDPRPIMREAYNMFKNGVDPEKVWFNASDLKVLSFFLLLLSFELGTCWFQELPYKSSMVAYNSKNFIWL